MSRLFNAPARSAAYLDRMSGHQLIGRAAAPVVGVVRSIRPEQLDAPTPCAEFDVRRLVNHLLFWGPSLEAAARKEDVPPPSGAEADVDLTRGDWAGDLVAQLERTAAAWGALAAWEGTTGMAARKPRPRPPSAGWSLGNWSYTDGTSHGPPARGPRGTTTFWNGSAGRSRPTPSWAARLGSTAHRRPSLRTRPYCTASSASPAATRLRARLMPPNQDHNYYATFISVADDCPATVAEEPPHRAGGLTAAQVHLQMARDEPYAHKQEQILFRAHLNSNGIDPHDEYEGGTRWTQFFSKGQPCLRTSALAKRYGWGFHFADRAR